MIFAVGDLVRDDRSRQLRFRHDRVGVEVTAIDVLRYLMRQARRPLTWEQILRAVWNVGFAGDTEVAGLDVTYPRTRTESSRATTVRKTGEGRDLIEPLDQA